MPDKKKPNHFNEKELRKFAVEIIDEDSLLLRCEQCGHFSMQRLDFLANCSGPRTQLIHFRLETLRRVYGPLCRRLREEKYAYLESKLSP